MPAAWLPVLDGRIRRARDDAGRGPAGDARLPNPADKRRRRLHLAEHLGQLLLPLYNDETGPTGGAPSVTALREAPDDVVGNEARDKSPFADSALHLLRRLRLVRVEVAIDGGAADTEPIGDLILEELSNAAVLRIDPPQKLILVKPETDGVVRLSRSGLPPRLLSCEDNSQPV